MPDRGGIRSRTNGESLWVGPGPGPGPVGSDSGLGWDPVGSQSGKSATLEWDPVGSQSGKSATLEWDPVGSQSGVAVCRGGIWSGANQERVRLWGGIRLGANQEWLSVGVGSGREPIGKECDFGVGSGREPVGKECDFGVGSGQGPIRKECDFEWDPGSRWIPDPPSQGPTGSWISAHKAPADPRATSGSQISPHKAPVDPRGAGGSRIPPHKAPLDPGSPPTRLRRIPGQPVDPGSPPMRPRRIPGLPTRPQRIPGQPVDPGSPPMRPQWIPDLPPRPRRIPTRCGWIPDLPGVTSADPSSLPVPSLKASGRVLAAVTSRLRRHTHAHPPHLRRHRLGDVTAGNWARGRVAGMKPGRRFRHTQDGARRPGNRAVRFRHAGDGGAARPGRACAVGRKWEAEPAAGGMAGPGPGPGSGSGSGSGPGPGPGPYLYELPAWLMCSFCRLMDALNRSDWERFGKWGGLGGTGSDWGWTGMDWDGVEAAGGAGSTGDGGSLAAGAGAGGAALGRRRPRAHGHGAVGLGPAPRAPAGPAGPAAGAAPAAGPRPPGRLVPRPGLPHGAPPAAPHGAPPALRDPQPTTAAPHGPPGPPLKSQHRLCLGPPETRPPRAIPAPPAPPPSALLSTPSLDPPCPDPPSPPDQALAWPRSSLSRLRPGPPPPPPTPPAPRPFCWRLGELAGATGGFADTHKVGEGGFGVVYRARLRHTDYAVKRLRQDADLDWGVLVKSFVTEAEKLSRYRHPNIVELSGVCAEGGHFCLVYVFMPNGSLEQRLGAQCPHPPLTWGQRLHVLLGTARALQFLHRDRPALVHGDVKSSNVLLDAGLSPRLSDFGLARAPRGGGGGRSGTLGGSRTLQGTLAYLPPEYLQGGALTPALDTYSFGVVVLEALTGRRAMETDARGRTTYLKELLEEEEEDEEGGVSGPPPDPRAGPPPPGLATALSRLAARCLHRRGKRRPAMAQVYEELERLQEGAPPTPPNQPEEEEEEENMAASAGLVINPARRRLMERLALYRQGRLDSLGLLASAGPPATADPQESDDSQP
ncbi:LOW QUALITY PROTEIN: interleukin-1 receptor-associated kinase 1 [Cariama cristata]